MSIRKNTPSTDAKYVARDLSESLMDAAEHVAGVIRAATENGDAELNDKLKAVAVEATHFLYENKLGEAFRQAFVATTEPEREPDAPPKNLADAILSAASAIRELAQVMRESHEKSRHQSA